MHGFDALPRCKDPRRQYRSARRHFRHGQRAAVLRAATAAKLYCAGAIPTLALAAACCGSSVRYVEAVTVLLKTENTTLLDRVLKGHAPLLSTAAQAKRVADLVAAYRRADDADRVAFMRTCGTEDILNELVEAAS
jgi:hypothetical protein